MRMPVSLNSTVIYTMLSVFGLLIIATAITWALPKLKPQKNWSELWLRVRSWWIMLGIFFLAIFLEKNTTLIFFALISFLALKEFLSLVPTRRADRRVLFWLYASIPLQYFWIGINWYGMFIVFIPVYLFFLLPMRMILVGETAGFLKAVSTLNWGAMTLVFNISHIGYLLVLPESRNDIGNGPALVLFLVILTQLNDVAQYLWGKTLGRHKIVPTVSPNKTVEGWLGGVITTTLLSLCLAPLFHESIQGWHAVGVGLLISIGGFIGDVTMSAVKRDIGVKDASAMIPGHGGILDRIDSLTFTAPLFFHYVDYFFY